MTATPSILFEDDILLALNKPSGLLTEGGAHREDDLEQQAQRYTRKKSYCCHRLDRLTSGVIIFRKTDHYKAKFGELFASRQIRKTYWGLVDGLWSTSQTRIETQIAPTDQRGVFTNAPSGGKTAISRFQILGTSTDQSSTWLSILLETGRTHQARLHCLHGNCPILGDKLYHPTSPSAYFGLHARELSFPHPKTGQTITITAPPPDSWTAPLSHFPPTS
jgi:RluA family pseudouridine synthase